MMAIDWPNVIAARIGALLGPLLWYWLWGRIRMNVSYFSFRKLVNSVLRAPVGARSRRFGVDGMWVESRELTRKLNAD
jgi:hypothetical protein